MRGKNRIGWGFGVLGLALTGWLGVLALPRIQFVGWWLIPASVGVVGIVLIIWGGIVLVRDGWRAKKATSGDARVRQAEFDAELQRVDADISMQEYFRMVADAYNDTFRIQQIDATLAELRSKRARLELG